MKVIKPASEVEGKLGSPQQMSDQISVHETLTKEMKNSGIVFNNCCMYLL